MPKTISNKEYQINYSYFNTGDDYRVQNDNYSIIFDKYQISLELIDEKIYAVKAFR